MSLFSLLHSLENTICQPHPPSFPDPEDRKALFIKNCSQFRATIKFLILYVIINLFISLESHSHLFWLGLVTVHFTSFLLFCRRQVWIMYWIYTASITFGQLIFIEMDQNSLVYILLISFLTPYFVLGLTKSLKHVLFNLLGQLYLLHYKYKDVLIDLLSNTCPIEFSNKFITAASVTLMVMTLTHTQFQNLLRKHQEELRISKHNAEQAYNQLTLFLQTFSHELRNPLNSLLGNLQLAIQEELCPKTYELVETAKICGDLLLQLINNILDTGKIQVGKLDYSLAPVRISDFVTGIWRISRDLIKRKKLNGCLRLDKRLPAMLNIDAYRINQVLLNLLSNAIKFTDKGEITICFNWLPEFPSVDNRCFEPLPYDDEGLFDKQRNFCTISRSSTNSDSLIYVGSELAVTKGLDSRLAHDYSKGVLKIIVRDTGAGIKAEDLKTMFAKFAQVGNDVTKKKIGTGLGLYISKEICETMGGEIRVYSKEGVGTTFIACIPASTPREIPRDISVDRLKERKLRVLIVDDSSFNLDLMANYVRKVGGSVVGAARDGCDGLEEYVKLRRGGEEVDVVCLDIDMPMMDGREVCRKIREFEDGEMLSPTKIVFVSGNCDEGQKRELLERNGGCRGDGFVKKPMDFDVFVSSLSKIYK